MRSDSKCFINSGSFSSQLLFFYLSTLKYKELSMKKTIIFPTPESRSRSISPSSEKLLFNQRLLLSLLLGICYAFLFYPGKVGLNAPIFDGLLLLIYLRTEPDLRRQPMFIVAAAGLLFSGISVVLVNSWLASLVHFSSLLLVFGTARVRELRFIWFALLLGALAVFRMPYDAIRAYRNEPAKRENDRNFHFRYALIPTLILLPFTAIYYQANPAFASLLNGFNVLGHFVSGWNVLLFGWGSWLAACLLFPFAGESELASYGKTFRDDIPRRSSEPRSNWFAIFQANPIPLGLKYEYGLAKGTLLGLNGLLLVVLLMDVPTIFGGYSGQSAAELSQFVHQGTYLLIFSILLAMLVIIVYFRGLLNFYPRIQKVRKLAFLWIGQNALLAVLVGVRNLRYVEEYGLAWGRVQVFFGLLLILFGLFTLYRKVSRRLSLSYLLHTNGMAAWLGLLLFAAVNWSGVITRYNLTFQAADRQDLQYLFEALGEGNDFLLCDEAFVARYLAKHHQGRDLRNLRRKLSPREYSTDWRSWNYADYRNERARQNFQQSLQKLLPHAN
jgi:hypothetical protein